MPTFKKELVILGVDPGLADTGFGIVIKQGNNLKILDFGCIKTKAGDPIENRLLEIHKSLNKLIKKYKPEIIAVEKIFFAKNVKTALSVGQARGVITLAAGANKLKFEEYTPLQIKQALTSYGKASKNQIKQMVKVMLKLNAPPRSDDAADALAAAICCANHLVKHV